MKASELIEALTQVSKIHGDLPIQIVVLPGEAMAPTPTAAILRVIGNEKQADLILIQSVGAANLIGNLEDSMARL